MVRTVNGDPTLEDGAVVPSGQWQPLSEAAAQALTAPPWTMPSMLVEIVRPPALTGENLEDLAQQMGDEEAQYLGLALAEPGVITNTDNYQDGRRIGLHLDNWDKLNYGQKRTGRRRLSLNSGPGSRYIPLGSLDAQAVCRAVHPENYAYR
ncbi:hypothetical protein [Streptomyces antarcticus]|uniref:hypothetical protein n=1 Tax=Streptomyces antarcticus TaxID=2996458 RepID=UPI00226FEFDE|nr:MULTISPECIES: hypothetical protein [unclassified Streptomyces]MCY0947511.1 hypothetical protein [Streptomyces sp. H34-AA3]MCZ4088410.1 hypothetical protein [Streptomyces sp. H34-S5]